MIGAVIGRLPSAVLGEVIGLALEAVIVAGVTWHFASGHFESQIDAERSTVKAAAAQAAASAAEISEKRVIAQQEIARDAQIQATRAASDAAAASRARDALRVQLDAVVRGNRGAANSSAAAGSQGQLGEDPIGVLADVLDRADQRAGILAEVAERRRVVAEACERDYDALTTH